MNCNLTSRVRSSLCDKVFEVSVPPYWEACSVLTYYEYRLPTADLIA